VNQFQVTFCRRCPDAVCVPTSVPDPSGAPDVVSGKRVCRLPAGSSRTDPSPATFVGANSSVHSPLRSVDANHVGHNRKSAFGTHFINGSNSSLKQQQQHPNPPQSFQYGSSVNKHDDIENQVEQDEQTKILSFELDAAFGQHQSTRWTVQLRDNSLFLNMATQQLMLVSKEAFVNLLEYAEEQLDCQNVIIKLDKARCEKSKLIIVFPLIYLN
jgi:hypothetical protein